jgi:hypothetical protein
MADQAHGACGPTEAVLMVAAAVEEKTPKRTWEEADMVMNVVTAEKKKARTSIDVLEAPSEGFYQGHEVALELLWSQEEMKSYI